MVIILGCCIVFITMKPKQSLIPIWLLCAAMLQAATLQAATTVTQVATVSEDSLFLKSDGSVWVMGFFGTNRPVQIISNGVVAIAGGNVQEYYLKSDGSLWEYDVGQIASNVISIAQSCARSDCLFIKADGSLWALGWNGFGQLGDGTFNNATTPEEIVASNVVACAAGPVDNLFIKSDGSLWGMGRNDDGELGDGTTNDVILPEEIASSGVIAAAVGSFNSLFLKSDDSLWGMGGNESGELGDGTYNEINEPEQIVSNGVVAISCGVSQSLFLKSDGSLWGMGDKGFGQLGDGTLGNPPIYATNQPEEIVSSNVVAISGGVYDSFFIKSDGSLWAMGINEFGGLGDGFTNYTSLLPEQIVPAPRAILMNKILSNTNLQFKATCLFGGTFYVLTSTNLAQPLSEWKPVWTNSVSARGTNNFCATLTNAVNSSAGQQFYILQSQ